MDWSRSFPGVLSLLWVAGEAEERVTSSLGGCLGGYLLEGASFRCPCPLVLFGVMASARQPSAGWHWAQRAVLGWASWVWGKRGRQLGLAWSEAPHLLLPEAATVLAQRQACGPAVTQRDGPPRRVWTPRPLVKVLAASVSEGCLVCS